MWTSLHFAFALPALRIALDKYSVDERTREILLSNTDATKYFPVFPHIENHYAEYQDLRAQYGEQSSTWWDETLESAFQGARANSEILPFLEKLPAFLRDRATRVFLNEEDSLIGRLVLANLADRDVPLDALRFDPRSESYLGSIGGASAKTLYERLRDTELRLGELSQYLDSHQPGQPIRLGALARIITWFSTDERPQKRSVVEMILPGLVGAAGPVANSLIQLITDIVQQGGPDYSKLKVDELPGRARKFHEEHSLRQIGRLSLIEDILYLDEGRRSGGATLRTFASRLYTEDQRQKDWGNATGYVPDPRDFDIFKQDVGNILYSAGLLEGKYGERGLGERLKALAWETKANHNLDELRVTIRAGSDPINQLAALWQKRYPGSERLLLARFVQLGFGLIPVSPIAIPLEEINRGFAGSNYDRSEGIHHLRYREAGEARALEIPFFVGRAAKKGTEAQAVYHTLDEGQPPRMTAEGIPFSAWFEIVSPRFSKLLTIPVPGRLSIDPFGQSGSAHAGEVVGYGCSVHHASLLVILVELACSGSSRETLTRVMEWFMSFNPDMHQRKEFARFQLEQVISAVEQGKQLSLPDYLRKNRHLADDPARQHLRRCLDGDRRWLEWAELRLAQLYVGFPHLYPIHHGSQLSPRSSWYDGRNVELNSATVRWASVVSAEVGRSMRGLLVWPPKRRLGATSKRLKERAVSFDYESVRMKPQNTPPWIRIDSNSLRDQFRELVKITSGNNRDPGPTLIVEARAAPNAEEPDLLRIRFRKDGAQEEASFHLPMRHGRLVADSGAPVDQPAKLKASGIPTIEIVRDGSDVSFRLLPDEVQAVLRAIRFSLKNVKTLREYIQSEGLRRTLDDQVVALRTGLKNLSVRGR